MSNIPGSSPPLDLPPQHYRQLAEFRYQLRQFLHFSEQVARVNGIEPRQYQLMLAIRGLPSDMRPTVTAISSRLCLRHHSTVELIDRLVKRGAAMRRQSEVDRREVLIQLTPSGNELLQQLAALHWQELQKLGPELSETLQKIVQHTPAALLESA